MQLIHSGKSDRHTVALTRLRARALPPRRPNIPAENRAAIASAAIILPGGVGEGKYAALMVSAIHNCTRNIELLRRGDTPLRVSCSRLADGRTAISIVEHVTQVLKPVGKRPQLPHRSHDLPQRHRQ